MEWIAQTCPCSRPGAASALFPVRDINFANTDATGVMLRCAACGSLHPDRVPSESSYGEAYGEADDDYYTTPSARTAWRQAPGHLLARLRRDYLDRHAPEEAARILDYGCGDGAFLTRLATRRPRAALYGADRGGPAPADRPFRWLDLDAVESAAPYDWITLGHVIEHVPRPAAVLSRLAALLTPGGGLWIATPNAAQFLFDTAGAWARDVDYPRHRQIFSRSALVGLLVDSGLEAHHLAAPPINAALNSLQTLRNLAADRAQPLSRRMTAGAATATGLARHALSSATGRAADSPELVVIGRRPLDGLAPPARPVQKEFQTAV